MLSRSRFDSQLTMAMDAMRFSTREIIGRVYDNPVVTVKREADAPWHWGGYRDVIVRVEVNHRGRAIFQEQRLRPEMAADEQVYCDYLRERMPAEIARKFLDFILRNPQDAPSQK